MRSYALIWGESPHERPTTADQHATAFLSDTVGKEMWRILTVEI